ncbi:hypothetical protein PROFUN_04243 [Planoprotostelium fungivorum]|uniref:Uncharacterized protein n=1 Tax=Planoprotostelium fungivorum TaxID=1890364 RepID=A0A2P6NUY4_9EUKA|nr:hypothetical protein PROFUN_04243 [Planoprotostelium fungivorum]
MGEYTISAGKFNTYDSMTIIVHEKWDSISDEDLKESKGFPLLLNHKTIDLTYLVVVPRNTGRLIPRNNVNTLGFHAAFFAGDWNDSPSNVVQQFDQVIIEQDAVLTTFDDEDDERATNACTE